MDRDYWLRQDVKKPLFPDLMWSKPETKSQAGKLLILGGNVHGFSAAAESFNEATKAGIGTARVLMPDILQKTVALLNKL
jgi:NAD(P)H-hydrate repair Nnr-like enzyme with NAD(P)H-hydrate dehydratase domain